MFNVKITPENLEDVIEILRIICGCSVIAMLFKPQWLLVVVALISYGLIRFPRKIASDKEETTSNH